jgi:hypothetical protein
MVKVDNNRRQEEMDETGYDVPWMLNVNALLISACQCVTNFIHDSLIPQVSPTQSMSWLQYTQNISSHVAVCSLYFIQELQLLQSMSQQEIDASTSHLSLIALTCHPSTMPLKTMQSFSVSIFSLSS